MKNMPGTSKLFLIIHGLSQISTDYLKKSVLICVNPRKSVDKICENPWFFLIFVKMTQISINCLYLCIKMKQT